MDRDKLFTLSFILTMTLLLYFLGNSITGHVIQTSYCDDSGCHEFCTSSTECSAQEVCCQVQDFGVCKSGCDNQYEMLAEVEYPVPYTEMPVKPSSYLYISLIFLTVIVGTLYFLSNKKVHVKVQ